MQVLAGDKLPATLCNDELFTFVLLLIRVHEDKVIIWVKGLLDERIHLEWQKTIPPTPEYILELFLL